MDWNRKYGLAVQEDPVGYNQCTIVHLYMQAKYEAYFRHSSYVKSSKARWMREMFKENEND